VVSVGNVPLGIYRKGRKPKSPLAFSNYELAQNHGAEHLRTYQQLVLTSNIRQTLKNINEKLLLNFSDLNNLLLTTFTFNTSQKSLKYSRAPWSNPNCFFSNCQLKHQFSQMDEMITAKLAGKKSVQSLFYE